MVAVSLKKKKKENEESGISVNLAKEELEKKTIGDNNEEQ